MSVPSRTDPFLAPAPAPSQSVAGDGFSLFRQQALVARHKIFDQPLLLRASGLHGCACVLLLLCGIGAALLAFQPYSEKIAVQGFAEHGAGHVRVRAPAGAVVERIAVQAGQWVEPGDVLLQLGSDAVAIDGESRGALEQQALEQEAQVLQRRQSLIHSHHQQRVAALRTQRRRLQAHGALLTQSVAVARTQLSMTRQRADAFATLAREGVLARSVAHERQQQVLVSERALLDAQRLLSNHQLALGQVEAQRQQLLQQHNEALVRWSQDDAQLRQRRAAASVRSHRLLTAVAAGTVSAIVAQVGQRLRPNQHVMSLLAKSVDGATVSLLVPSRARGAIAKGQTVRLRYAGYPFQKYGMPLGRIVGISRAPVRGDELDYPVAANAMVYLAQVAVPPALPGRSARWSFDPAQAAPGMQLHADILVRSDPIWRRVLEPLARLRLRA